MHLCDTSRDVHVHSQRLGYRLRLRRLVQDALSRLQNA